MTRLAVVRPVDSYKPIMLKLSSRLCLIVWLIATIQTCTIVRAQDEPATASLKDKLEEIRSEFSLPALAGCIVTVEGVTEIASCGIRKTGDDTLVTDNDLWHLGSCTKAMTATLLATLVQQGKLTWETTLAEIFPELVEQMNERQRSITVTHLLTHRSGFPANVNWHQLGKGTTTEQRKVLLKKVCKMKLSHEPGKHFEYSNVGFALAGLIAETIADQSWEELMKERIFKPLSMSDVGFGVPGTIDQTDQPWGHMTTFFGFGPLKAVQLDNAASLGPAGTVHASLTSWSKFISLHLSCDENVLTQSSWDFLHTPPDGTDYAMGWNVLDRGWAKDVNGDGLALSHNGSNTVNHCVCWLAPQRKFAVLAVTNSGQTNAPLALDRVASLLIIRHLETKP